MWPYDWNEIDTNYTSLYNFTMTSDIDKDISRRMVANEGANEV